MESGDQVLKVDKRGRVWTPPERRAAILEEFSRSGMPAVRFAGHIGVKYSTFANWVQQHRREQKSASIRPRGAVSWVEAIAAGPGNGLCIELPGGARMHVADVQQARVAAEVLRALCLAE